MSAAQSLQDIFGADRFFLVFMCELNHSVIAFLSDLQDFRSGVNIHPFLAESVFHRACQVCIASR